MRVLTAGDKIVGTRNQLGQPVYMMGQAGCAIYAQCPPAVIHSSGKYNLGTNAQGVHQASAVADNVDERQNDSTAVYFISRQRSGGRTMIGGEFDDMVLWIPTEQLNARLRAVNLLY